MYYMPEQSYLSNDYCIPIQVGFHETGIDMGIQKDNEGNNRALKHPLYSEYSGIYWLWKNINAEYKGMMHHRRSLSLERISVKHYLKILVSWSRAYIKNSITKYTPYSCTRIIECYNTEEYMLKCNLFFKELPHLLEAGYDIIVPSPYHFYWTNVGEIFDEVVGRILLSKLKNVIKIRYPIYYDYFLKNINGSELYYANINIMRDYYFNEYNEFAFCCFDELESELVKEGYYITPDKEKSLYRIFGYIGELLLSTYIHAKKKEGIRIKELSLLFNKEVPGYIESHISKIRL